jgi:hypothetical protein
MGIEVWPWIRSGAPLCHCRSVGASTVRSKSLGAGGRGWVALSLLLAVAALVTATLPDAWLDRLDWQPRLALIQPWRLWTAAAVHWTAAHLVLDLAGLLLLAALGYALGLPRRAVLAWALAWPLTQAGLWLHPGLPHYGGLSGVLHAGAAVLALQLLAEVRPTRRVAGWVLAAALGVKLVHEVLGGAVPLAAGQAGIAVSPWPHVSGAVCAALGWAGVSCLARVCGVVRSSCGAEGPG